MKNHAFFVGVVASILFVLYSFSLCAQGLEEREYVIGIGDQLNIQVWEIPELSASVSVRFDGKITLPRLGDVQAAGLRVSSLRTFLAGVTEGKETIGKYVKNPQITITVTRPSENVRLLFSGIVSRRIDVPRGTTIAQVVSQVVPSLPTEPPPNLTAIRVISAEGEEFPVNFQELQRSVGENIRLEWGDTIYIPSLALPTPTPQIQATAMPTPSAIYSEEELRELLWNDPEKLDLVISVAEQLEDGSYSFNIAKISEEQQALIGEELLTTLLGELPPPPTIFTDIMLVGLNVNLARDDIVEAYLAFPASEPDTLPRIQRFHEDDLIEQGPSEQENIYLEKIIDSDKQVILRKGELRQSLTLPTPFTQAKFSGVYTRRNQKAAFFSDLNRSESKRPPQRSFVEDDEVEEGVKLAKITDQWVLLKQDENIQLVLLRDSFNRPTPVPTPVPLPTQLELPPEAEGEQAISDLPVSAAELLKQASPETLQALDTFSELFFATPLLSE
ncbi:hypothetical protein CSA56_17630 [candidate division KSB3 bacterium]|uniref:Polysaccharide export protein N-terminal domain-containing protein n=1 Tax=candidate division KSB3 bacterium TaxID=2044937 RepID=A0A2G6K7N2_9BACT|nr:MAG: hypothetical protein CSA56_17630 [candidate division KSB3 bacterium]